MDALTYRWQKFWSQLLPEKTRTPAQQTALDVNLQDVFTRYTEKQRFYHNTQHLTDVFQKLDWLKGQMPIEKDMLNTIELAIFYHDIVYDPTKHDNEAQSRDLFLSHAKILGLPEQICKDVARLIDITAKHTEAKNLDEMILCDCDLAILGSAAPVFARYDRAIGQEYSFVPKEIYAPKRREILRRFKEETPIFKTKPFHDALEKRALRNLTDATTPTPKPTPPAQGV